MRNVILYILALFFTLGIYSCTDEETLISSGQEEEEVTILLNTSSSPASYAMTESPNGGSETYVGEIDVLAFKEMPGGELYYDYHRIGTEIQDVAGSDGIKKQFKVTLTKNQYRYVYVIIANFHAKIEEFLQANIHILDKEVLLSQLVSTIEGDRWKANSGTDFKAIPMWGETPPINIPPLLQISGVDLVRSLSRVDVFHATSLNFTLQEVFVYNFYKNGRITPAPRQAGWSSTYQPPSIPGPPYLATIKRQYPTSTGVKNDPTRLIPYGGANGSHTGDFETFTESSETRRGLRRVIYLYESDLPVNDNHLDATCLVVGGIYQGTKYYYRVDFLHPSADANKYDPTNNGFYMGGQTKGTLYRPLIRNTNYALYINSVSGPGYPTPDEAFEKADSKNGMTVVIVSWTNGDIPPVITGEHYLRVNRSEFIVTTSGYVGKIKVETNYPVAWTFSTNNSTAITNMSKTATNELTFTVSDHTVRNAKIKITAGNMTKEIVINP